VTPMSSASRRELVCATAFSAARADLTLTETATRAYLGWPEANQVLDGSVRSLWRSILTPDETEGLLPLSPEQKSWLLFHAGALRGFNLALITAWRPTADTLEGTDVLYPGFSGHCAITHALVASEWPVLMPGRRDDRGEAERVTRGSLEMIRTGLEHGYGLGFVVDAALDDGPGGGPITPASPTLAAAAIAKRLGGRGVGHLAPAIRSLARLRPDERRRLAAETLADAAAGGAVRRHIAAVSQARPMAVPATVGRFSWGYVATMLAYASRWWIMAGITLAARENAGDSTATAAGDAGIGDVAIEWARQDLAAVAPVLDKPDELRWRLATVAEETTAVAWRVASESGSWS